MRQQFWLLGRPRDTDDYQSAYLNGAVEYAYRLPAMGCPGCARRVAGRSVLPFACPQELRSDDALNRGFVTASVFGPLRDRLLSLISADQRGYVAPGMPFAPGILDVPSTPSLDFLWPELRGPLVSRRVQQLLEETCAADVYFTPVAYRKIGRRTSSQRSPIPYTGEPEDVIHAVPLLSNTSKLPSYHRLNVRYESAWPADVLGAAVCDECGQPGVPARQSMPAMTESMWKGHDVFYLATTLGIVVTQAVHDHLQAIGATNVAFAAAV